MSENTQKESKKKSSRKDSSKTMIAELEAKVATLEEKAAKDRDDYVRLMAEFDNYRRRTSQEKLEIKSFLRNFFNSQQQSSKNFFRGSQNVQILIQFAKFVYVCNGAT